MDDITAYALEAVNRGRRGEPLRPEDIQAVAVKERPDRRLSAPIGELRPEVKVTILSLGTVIYLPAIEQAGPGPVAAAPASTPARFSPEELDGLSFAALKAAAKDLGLSAGGDRAALRARLAEWAANRGA